MNEKTSPILVDNREPDKIATMLRNYGDEVIVVQLQDGDVAGKAIDGILHLFEFKRIYTGDASNSIFTAHLKDQILRLIGFEEIDGKYVLKQQTNTVIHLIMIGSEGHLPANIQKAYDTVKAEYASLGVDVREIPSDDIACHYVHQTLQFVNHRRPIQAPIVDNLPASECGTVRALMQVAWVGNSELKVENGKRERRDPGIGRVKATIVANNRSIEELTVMTIEQLSEAMRVKPPKAKKPKNLKAAISLHAAFRKRTQTITPEKLAEMAGSTEDEEE